MKLVDMELVMVVIDYLFFEFNILVDFFLRKNIKIIKWINGIEN